MIKIDGSQGEGGGQILRTSLALSLVTGQPFRIVNIRAGRKRPGLLRQHLTAVEAAGTIGQATVDGAGMGSQVVSFKPQSVTPGEYRFAVGTAGSAMLVLQTVLPPLWTATSRSELTLEGGTHNPFAPPFDFLQRAFLPLVVRMGPSIEVSLVRPGFFPAGGGEVRATIEPAASLTGFELLERGEIERRRVRAVVANLPRHIADRELKVVSRRLAWPEECFAVEEVRGARGPGNLVSVEVHSEHLTEVFTSFGQRGVRAEAVAESVVEAVERYLNAEVPVGEHLADQLLVPLGLAGGGAFRTHAPSNHLKTNAAVLKHFLGVSVSWRSVEGDAWVVEVGD
jgi:RNA 3'-terminal phosphate cyclase (ATP)